MLQPFPRYLHSTGGMFDEGMFCDDADDDGIDFCKSWVSTASATSVKKQQQVTWKWKLVQCWYGSLIQISTFLKGSEWIKGPTTGAIAHSYRYNEADDSGEEER